MREGALLLAPGRRRSLIHLTFSGVAAIFASSRYATAGWRHILKPLVRDLAEEPLPSRDSDVAVASGGGAVWRPGGSWTCGVGGGLSVQKSGQQERATDETKVGRSVDALSDESRGVEVSEYDGSSEVVQ